MRLTQVKVHQELYGKANALSEFAAVIDIILILQLYFACYIIILASKPLLGTSAILKINKLADDLLKSTNWYTVDIDKQLTM